jgi:hypothetical protein
MSSSSSRSSQRVRRIPAVILVVVLGAVMFAAFDRPQTDASVTAMAASQTVVGGGSGAAGEPLIHDIVATLGREAVRVLTTMLAAVFEGWWQPVDGALDWIDGVRRGWAAVHRFPATGAPRS